MSSADLEKAVASGSITAIESFLIERTLADRIEMFILAVKSQQYNIAWHLIGTLDSETLKVVRDFLVSSRYTDIVNYFIDQRTYSERVDAEAARYVEKHCFIRMKI
jgi:uncharacterized pyridoxal phosphate-containing UPF0001 family protein